MMPSNITELRPDLKLLTKNFEGYKLSLETVPVIKHKLQPLQPNVIAPNIDQYSLLHATLYSLHNHLFKDPFEPYITYIIDTSNIINKFVFNRETQRFFVGDNAQFQLPQSEDLDKIYNSSMKFISEQYVIVSTGSKNIYLIDTLERTNLNSWQIIFSQSVVENNNGFIILDAHLEESNGQKNVHCLLQHIEKNEKSFENRIDWIIIKQDSELTWSLTKYKELLGKGTLQYCALESTCRAVYIASDHKYKFKLSEEQIKQMQLNKSEKEISFDDFINWHQSEEEVTILVTFKEFVDKKLLSVATTTDSLKIVYKTGEQSETLLELSEKVDVGLTTWSMVDANILEIVLYKLISKPWQNLTKEGEKVYKEIPNPIKVSEIHEKLKHLCSEDQNEMSAMSSAPIQDEIDDCDFDADYDIKDWSLERLCPEENLATHHVHIGSCGPLFKYSSECNTPPFLTLRHDVDGLVWEMPKSDHNWPPKHIATLPAFGYVQASKQDKKFVSCSPDFNYSVICNGNRHIFIYWGDDSRSYQLQNRKSKQKMKVGTQKVITLDDAGDIIGLQTENDIILVLTVNYIIALQLNFEMEP